MTRPTPLLALAVFATACSGGGHFDLVVTANQPVARFHLGTTQTVIDEYQRAEAAAVEGTDGALPLLANAFDEVLPGVDASKAAVSADGRRGATLDSATRVTRFSLVDQKLETTDVEDAFYVAAVSEDGRRLAYVTNEPLRLRVVDVAGASLGEVALEGTAPNVVFAGDTVYLLELGQLNRVNTDGSKTAVSTPKPYVSELVAEPRSGRTWGLARTHSNQSDDVIFRLDAGATRATELEGMPALPSRLSVTEGGRLAFIGASQLYLTGPDGADPQQTAVGSDFSNVFRLAIGPGGSYVATIVGDGIGVIDTAPDSDEAYGVGVSFTPRLIVPRLP